MADPDIVFILFKRNGKAKFAACRGKNKGCNVNMKTRSKLGPCEFCVLVDDNNGNMTIGEFKEKLERGDA